MSGDDLVVVVRFRGDQRSFELAQNATFGQLAEMVGSAWNCSAKYVELHDSDACSWPSMEKCSLWMSQLPDGVVYARIRTRKAGTSGITAKIETSKGDSSQLLNATINTINSNDSEYNSKMRTTTSPKKRRGIKGSSIPYVRKTRAIMLQEKKRDEMKRKSQIKEMSFTTSGDIFRKKIQNSSRIVKRESFMKATTANSTHSLEENILQEMSFPTSGDIFGKTIQNSSRKGNTEEKLDAWQKLEKDLEDIVQEKSPSSKLDDEPDSEEEQEDYNTEDISKVDLSIDLQYKGGEETTTNTFEALLPKRKNIPKHKVRKKKSMVKSPRRSPRSHETMQRRFRLSTLPFSVEGERTSRQQTSTNDAATFDAYDELWRIFTFYCLQSSKPGQIEHMSNKQFIQLLHDSRLLLNNRESAKKLDRNLIRQEVDIIFMKASDAKTSLGYVTFEQFLQALKKVAHSRILSGSKKNQKATNPKKSNTSSQSSSQAAVQELIFQKILPNAKRWIPDPKLKLLRMQSVVNVLYLYRDFFEKLIKVYTSASDSCLINFKTFLKICNAFSITTLNITALDIGMYFLMAKTIDRKNILKDPNRSKLALSEFTSCMGLLALHAFELKQIPYERKIKGLIMHMALNNQISGNASNMSSSSYSRRNNVGEVAGYLHGKFIEMWIRDGKQNYLTPASIATAGKKYRNGKNEQKSEHPFDLSSPLSFGMAATNSTMEIQTYHPLQQHQQVVNGDDAVVGQGGGDKEKQKKTVLRQQGSKIPTVFDELDSMLETDVLLSGMWHQEEQNDDVESDKIERRNTIELEQRGGASHTRSSTQLQPSDGDNHHHRPDTKVITTTNTSNEQGLIDAKHQDQNVSRRDDIGENDDPELAQHDDDEQVDRSTKENKMYSSIASEAEDTGAVLDEYEGSESKWQRETVVVTRETPSQGKIQKLSARERNNTEIVYDGENDPIAAVSVSILQTDTQPGSQLEELQPEEGQDDQHSGEEKELLDRSYVNMMTPRHATEEGDPNSKNTSASKLQRDMKATTTKKFEPDRDDNVVHSSAATKGGGKNPKELVPADSTGAAAVHKPRDNMLEEKKHQQHSEQQQQQQQQSKMGNNPLDAADVKPMLTRENTQDLKAPIGQGKSDDTMEVILEELKKGSAFIKYGRRGSPRERLLWVSDDGKTLFWGENRKRHSKSFPIASIRDVCVGQKTQLFKRRIKKIHKKEMYSRRSFSLLFKSKDRISVDLIACTDRTFELWMQFFNLVISFDKSKHLTSGDLMKYVKRMKSTHINVRSERE
mmetsp:Transcript_25689/g.43028  ORF Transcript_25689/g.43028 Transcript_25689/m.43028 type:complete len:1282 (-) Transcript_25689:210-4055(-)